MGEEGSRKRGLYAEGLMIHDGHPKASGVQCTVWRPGNPTSLMRMKGDIVPILEACMKGTLSETGSNGTTALGMRGDGFERLSGRLREREK